MQNKKKKSLGGKWLLIVKAGAYFLIVSAFQELDAERKSLAQLKRELSKEAKIKKEKNGYSAALSFASEDEPVVIYSKTQRGIYVKATALINTVKYFKYDGAK